MKNITILFVTALALLGFGTTAHAKPKIAILGLEVIDNGGVDQKTTKAAQDFAQELRSEAVQSAGKYSLAPNSAQDLLELKLLSGCSDEGRTCMAAIGKDLGADRLLYGKLERRKKGYQISLKLLNTTTRQMEKTTTELIPSADLNGPKISQWAKVLYSRLIGIPQSGTLVIKANIDRATVYVDGNVMTTLRDGSAKLLGIKDGMHSITIEAEGYESFEADVAVDAGETERLSINMERIIVYKKPETFQEKDTASGSGWKIAFVGGVLVTSGMAAGWTFNGLKVWGQLDEDKLEAFNALKAANSAVAEDISGVDSCNKAQNLNISDNGAPELAALVKACDRGEKAAKRTNFFIAGTAIAAAATAYFGYQGWVVHGKKNKERLSGKGKRKKKTRVVVTPQVTLDSFGAGLSLEF